MPERAVDHLKTLYDRDFYTWTQHQAAHLRARDWDAVDVEHLAEEIAALGIAQRHAVQGHLRLLLAHLLKWQYQPRKRSRTWQTTILNARTEIEQHLADNPGLQHVWPELLAWAYPKAQK